MTNDERLALIVEDSSADAKLLERTLRQVGVTSPIRVLTGGREALAYLAGDAPFADRKANPLPTVVFLDIKLPDVSGMEVLRWITSQPSLRRLIVIVHSGYSNTRDIDALYAAGANSFLRKSHDQEELRCVVDYFKGHFTVAAVHPQNVS